eukprot:gene9368-12621_t
MSACKILLRTIIGIALIVATLSMRVGVGIGDITGPSVEINFMGYALPGQRGTGIHLRLWSRAFVFEQDDKRVAFVSVDGGMGSDLVNYKVIERLNSILGEAVYTLDNLAISGTHTHSGPAGFLQYVLYQVTSFGYVQETLDAWVEGITNSIVSAHKSLRNGKAMIAQGSLTGSNINRSPTSYLLNPESERNQYKDGNTDKNMLLVNVVSETGKSLGVVNWFAVHGTSMNNTNTLTSGDNRGYASYALEKELNGKYSVPGMGPFVSAFASTNLGDVSPNTNGAKCIDTGLDCEPYTSTCNGRSEKCIAFGPGTNGDIFESTQIIGDKQFQHALNLMNEAKEELRGTVDYRHSFVDMSKLNVKLSDGSNVRLCSPAMGYAFAAGTTDGPGMFGFTQNTTSGNPFWDRVRDFLSEPTAEEIACQAPKPILLNTADIAIPYDWDPRIVPIQILRVGNLFILSAPSEFTTMAGRRLRNAIRSILENGKVVAPGQEIFITIAGLTNCYSSYVTTYEEYQAQRYEAASTIFGPHTLEGYIQEFSRLANDLVAGTPSEPGTPPPDLTGVQIQLMPLPKFDRVANGAKFGDIVEGKDVEKSYVVGQIAKATFHGANPRNNQKLQGTFMTVERLVERGSNGLNVFKPIAFDGDWSTKFTWQAGPEDPLDFGISKQSVATLIWDIPADTEEGTYRLCYFGDHKVAVKAVIVPFSGCSSEFVVSQPPSH